MRDNSDLTGSVFGSWSVIGSIRPSWYECRCFCGQVKSVRRTSLTRGVSTSCGCQRKRLLRESQFEGYEDISLSYWSNLKKNAQKRNLKVSITIEQAWDKFVEQNRLCALSGLPLGFGSGYGKGDGTASLDRIDSQRGYELDNVQWVHKDLNKMKNNMSQAQFLKWIETVHQFRSSLVAQ